MTLSLGVMSLATALRAGVGFGNRQSVGGVVIDGAGIVRTATLDERRELANLVRQNLQPLAGDLLEATEMRMLSLKGLQKAVQESHQQGVS